MIHNVLKVMLILFCKTIKDRDAGRTAGIFKICFSEFFIFFKQGDAAVGKGVTQHVFSLMMNKLKSGLSFNMGLCLRF